MSTQWTTRALEDEGPELARLFAGEPFVELARLAELETRAAPGRELWVLRQDARIAGVLVLDVGPLGRRLELTVAVLPELRRGGGGRALLAHARRRAERLGCAELSGTVADANESAHRFFASAGYARQDDAPPGHTRWSLLLALPRIDLR